ncbi:Spo0E family sporulation regulatory protein-aspartic acid phosphatase [Bacillota bacterium Lsc_1132]
MTNLYLKKLEETINRLQKKLIMIGLQEGLTSEKTIQISEQLDIYIVKLQKIRKEEFSNDSLYYNKIGLK